LIAVVVGEGGTGGNAGATGGGNLTIAGATGASLAALCAGFFFTAGLTSGFGHDGQGQQ